MEAGGRQDTAAHHETSFLTLILQRHDSWQPTSLRPFSSLLLSRCRPSTWRSVSCQRHGQRVTAAAAAGLRSTADKRGFYISCVRTLKTFIDAQRHLTLFPIETRATASSLNRGWKWNYSAFNELKSGIIFFLYVKKKESRITFNVSRHCEESLTSRRLLFLARPIVRSDLTRMTFDLQHSNGLMSPCTDNHRVAGRRDFLL